MDALGWILVVVLFAVGMAGAIFPILPGVLAVYGAFFVYGLFFGFGEFGFWFWLLQTSIVAALLIADYVVNAWGVKKFGGSRASVIGSTIGIIAGPFVIPGVGLIVGPFLGAWIGELLAGADMKQATRAGLGALVGFLSSTVVKLVLQTIMIALFIVWIIAN
ncbi:DUF456 domain-containing protein [Paenibacillus flagellatus]|uniref:DUF456 domain-containing protein n=1 Tax=Paenibacillus flagellatus TaxID=2211139 RepID=A0A2V5KWD4_9BACL|nr:DUF456 family protein [Paenibacillus flagellatus]PYI54006.1 DUF456 domain-containing protein [Paenibacillus flagellatus]